MSNPIDTHTFDAIEERDIRYRIQIRKDNWELTQQIEEGIRYQYELHEKVASYLNNKFDNYDVSTSTLINKRIAMSHSLYTQNFSIIHAAYSIMLTGKISSAYVLERRIHESILEQYYVGLCSNDEFCEYAELSEKKIPTKLGYNFYKQKLYQGDVLDYMSNMYSELSNFTHSTWKTLMIGITYNKELVEDSLKILRHNLLFNVISYCQIFNFDKDFLKIIIKFVQPFVDEQLVNSEYGIVPWSPNHENISDKVIWYNYNNSKKSTCDKL